MPKKSRRREVRSRKKYRRRNRKKNMKSKKLYSRKKINSRKKRIKKRKLTRKKKILGSMEGTQPPLFDPPEYEGMEGPPLVEYSEHYEPPKGMVPQWRGKPVPSGWGRKSVTRSPEPMARKTAKQQNH